MGLANMNVIRLWEYYNDNSGKKPISYIEFARQLKEYIAIRKNRR